MKIFEFSELTLPAVENKLEPRKARKLMASIGALMLGQRYDTFQNEGKDVSPPWAPLSRRYAKWKLKRYRGKGSKILSLTNALRMSFSSTSARASKPDGDGSLMTNETEAQLESHVPYAAIQNFGGVIKKQNDTRKEMDFKIYKSGDRAGRHSFASKKDVEKGDTRNVSLVRRSIKGHKMATYVTIPARRFDTFSENDTGEIRELIEDFIK